MRLVIVQAPGVYEAVEPLTGGRRLHIREFLGIHWEHVDEHDPAIRPWAHLEEVVKMFLR